MIIPFVTGKNGLHYLEKYNIILNTFLNLRQPPQRPAACAEGACFSVSRCAGGPVGHRGGGDSSGDGVTASAWG